MDDGFDSSASRADSVNIACIGLHELVIALRALGDDVESSQPELLPQARGDQAGNPTGRPCDKDGLSHGHPAA